MQPIRKYSAGGIIASIWQNQAKDGSEFFSVSLDKRYKDADGQWKSSSSFKSSDLPKAMLVLQKSYEFMALKENILSEEQES
jgi:hypothetical protein